MQQRIIIAQASPQEPADDAGALARAIEVITARQYRHQGDALLARYTASIRPLMPDAEYIARRGVDLIALARAIEKGLDVEMFGQVIQYRAWPIDEFNRFIRAGIGCDMVNSGMRLFLDHPRNW